MRWGWMLGAGERKECYHSRWHVAQEEMTPSLWAKQQVVEVMAKSAAVKGEHWSNQNMKEVEEWVVASLRYVCLDC